MPYIKHARRLAVIEDGSIPANVGELTYAIQQQICAYLEDKVLGADGKPLSYAMLAEVLGALEGAKVDFIDRVLKPYEKRKRRENRDAWGALLIGEAKHGR